MSILTLLLAFLFVGVGLWAINTFIPMDTKIKTLLNVVVVIVFIVWLLKAFGIFGYLNTRV